jgi:hypothetical protein
MGGSPKVRQQDSLLVIGDDDVGRFDVTVQQPAFVGVIQSLGDRGDNVCDLFRA